MSINNREDANKYYQIMNELVDEYIDKWKIRPAKLKKYLSPGSKRFNRFLERNRLGDVKGADVILNDIIEDRFHMESDGVLTFENYKFLESAEFKIHSLKQCLYKGIEKSDIKMEKIIADYFDTNLGEIDVVDSDKHLFKISSWGNDGSNIVIYSKEDIDLIVSNMIDHLFDELSKNKVELTESISIDLSDLIKKENFTDKMNSIFTKEFSIKIITDCLGDKYQFNGELEGYCLWSS
jgi:hypothetical protein